MSVEDPAGSLLLEEAYALALDGRFCESLTMLDGWSSGPAIGVEPLSFELFRARVLIARGEPGDLEAARRLLESSRKRRTEGGWRGDLTLARLDLRDGHPTRAAVLLKQALDGFRGHGEIHPDAAPALARMLVREADRLGRSPTGSPIPASTPAEPQAQAPPESRSDLPDAASLLGLIELGKSLAEETDPEQVLRIVLHEAIDLSGTDRGFVVLVKGEALDFAMAENLDWSLVEQPGFEVSRTLIRTAIDEAKPIFLRVADVGDDHGAARSLGDIGAHSVACVPLVRSGRPLGVLYLDGRDPAHVFTQARERLIELFASQAAAALENARAHREKSRALAEAEATIRRQRGQEERRERYFDLIGASDEMQVLYRNLDRIAPTDAPVLILGGTGTGKELVARILHRGGPRRARPLVTANCASVPENLLESELFGHERGAFTGAERARAGLFEQTDGGTLFLDEVGDMSARMQADLLRVLQSGEVRRVGGRETKHVDVRVIAATHRDLEDMIRRGEFRQDLYFRLRVLSVRLPALRDRPGDVALIVSELLPRFAVPGQSVPVVSERALRSLEAYDWPGNVRELENVVRHLLVQGVETIEEEHLPAEILRQPVRRGHATSLRRIEAAAIRRAVEAAGGSRTEAARLLGIDRKTLYLKLKRLELGLDPDRGC
jgi:transcriptional regulator with GAF, ATPase, and Fis domain